MKIREQLQQKIHEFRLQRLRNDRPNAIIMHFKKLQQLTEELYKDDRHDYISSLHHDKLFQGIRIFSTPDIDVEEIIIY